MRPLETPSYAAEAPSATQTVARDQPRSSTSPARGPRRGLLLTSLSLALGCTTDKDALADHQALWARSGPPSYQYTITSGGFAPSGSLRVTVTNRAVTSAVPVGETFPTAVAETFEELFADVGVQLDSNCKVTVHYDEALGYPLSLYSDCGMEGSGWTVSDFAALP
jgi:hypothetical protein